MDYNAAVIGGKCISKSYGGRLVLDCISIRADRGELVAVVGPNGSGKTTLLRILAGLEEPDSGIVIRRGSIAMVFQENLLLPWRSLRDNIMLGLRYSGLSKREALRRVEWAARLLGIEEHLDKKPGEVSGGTARKAAIARMLVLNPDILLLDEPLAGLDVSSRLSLLQTLNSLRSDGRTIIFVDHNIADVASVADRVYLLTPAPARVSAVVELGGLPREERLRRLIEALEGRYGVDKGQD